MKKELPRDTRQLVDQYAETWIETTPANSDRKTSTKTMYAAVARHQIVGSQLGATPVHRGAAERGRWVAGRASAQETQPQGTLGPTRMMYYAG